MPAGVKHGRVLRAKLALAARALISTPRAGGPETTRRLASVLFTMHCYTRASVPLMQSALAQARDISQHDPVARGMLDYLECHILEEREHAQWLLEDLEVLGVSAAEVLARAPAVSAAEAVGAQYYWIHHYHPVALLGYIAALEDLYPSVHQLRSMMANPGYLAPPSAPSSSMEDSTSTTRARCTSC